MSSVLRSGNMRIRASVTVKNYELEERRKKLGYTQIEFAEILGMNKNTYASIENMKLQPTEEEAIVMSLEFNTDVDILFPNGYEKMVEVFKKKDSTSRVVDYIPPMLEDGDHQLLLEQTNAKLTVQTLLKKTNLSPREIKVLHYRHGFDNGDPKTYEDVANIMGVTRERVRQIETKAFEKIRDTVSKPIKNDK